MNNAGAQLHGQARWPIVEACWQEVLRTIPAAAYTCDANGLITYFNRIAESVWGRTPKLRDVGERYCGSHRLYLRDGTPVPHEQCWMALALLEGKAYHGREIVIERPDGSRTLGEAHAYPLRNDQGQLVGAVNLVADVATLGAPASVSGESSRSSFPRDAVLAMIDVALSLSKRMTFERV